MEERLALFCKGFICSSRKKKNHANARGHNIISTGTSLLSYINVGENIAKSGKTSNDTAKSALCSLIK